MAMSRACGNFTGGCMQVSESHEGNAQGLKSLLPFCIER